MPSNYITLSTVDTIQVLDAQTTDDVVYVTAATKPSGIRFATTINSEVWNNNQGGETLANLAVALEVLVTDHHVVAGTPTQDLDPSQLLVDYVDLVIKLDRSAEQLPSLYSTAHIPMTSFYGTELGIGGVIVPGIETPEQYCDAEYQRLEQIGTP